MPAAVQVEPIVQKVEQWLSEAESNGIHLKVSGHTLDDDWLYVVVIPKQAGVRASDHAKLMAEIEQKLRADGEDRVLLVPALDD